MTEHSSLPPSSAARRVACPGSRAMEKSFKHLQNYSYAKEGEAAHEIAAQLLKSGDSDIETHVGMTASNGELITEEMIEGAILYHETIRGILHKYIIPATFTMHIEEQLDISTIHAECWGTPDCWFEIGKDIYIFDYKFGHGYVEVFENWQLIEYAAGILHKLKVDGLRDQHTFVHFCIVQPRSFHKDGPVRWWRVRASELRSYFNILRSAEAQAMDIVSAKCIPSPQCTHCSARHVCTALQSSILNHADITTVNVLAVLPPAIMGAELRYLKYVSTLLEARITGLEEEVKHYLHRGERVPYFKLESVPNRERWKVSPEEIITLGKVFDCDLAKPIDVITPKQAVKAGIPEEILPAYVERGKASLKLVSDDIAPRKIFGEK